MSGDGSSRAEYRRAAGAAAQAAPRRNAPNAAQVFEGVADFPDPDPDPDDFRACFAYAAGLSGHPAGMLSLMT